MNAASKDSLRHRLRAARAALAPDVHAAASHALGARLLALPEVHAARVVHSFWPAPDRGEPDLRPVLRTLHDRGVAVVLPRVVPGATGLMTHHEWDGGSLVPGAFGLPEPPESAPQRPPGHLDVVIVPALAADRRGHRLGYGKGYYDRFLPSTRAFTVAVVFDTALLDALPAEPHDRPVDAVVTDRQTHRIAQATATGA